RLHFVDAPQQETAFWLAARRGQCVLVAGGGLRGASQSAEEIGAHGRQEIVVLHGRFPAQLVERGQRSLRIRHHRLRNGPIQCNYGRRGHFQKFIVELQKETPVGGGETGARRVNRGDVRLEMILAQLFSPRGHLELSDAARQQRLVPSTSLLLVEQEE